MKNLFLHAKYFAIQENSEKITMKHIVKAVENMNLGKKQLEKDILKYLNDYQQKDDKKKSDLGVPF